MRRTRINEIRPAKLSDITQTLKNFGINEPQRQRVDADVIPDGVAKNLEPRAPFRSV
jgi:ribosomal protein S3